MMCFKLQLKRNCELECQIAGRSNRKAISKPASARECLKSAFKTHDETVPWDTLQEGMRP